MARLTRSRPRSALVPSAAKSETATPDSVSLLFSNRTSVCSESPITSDGNSNGDAAKSARPTKKRVAERGESASEQETLSRVASKRRATGRTAYIEISVPGQSKSAKGKGKSKGKAKAKSVAKKPRVSDYDDDDDDDDETTADAVFEESDDSGSEFQVSDEDLDDLQDSDGEEVMLDTAIRMSLQTARSNQASNYGAGPSIARPVSTNRRATIHAAAAERRLATYQADRDSDMSDLDVIPSDVEELPKSKSMVAVKSSLVAQPTIMTFNDMKKVRQERRGQRKLCRLEEYELMIKLGRKLTQAEKSTVALHKFHPELRNIWGDLEENTPIIQPQKAAQPENLKVTLLPFQQESLYWMRRQENTIWKGGMLADEMGMGKTIQIIALFVTDLKKPNLVVAPTVAVMQWKNEIAAHTEGLSVLIWHGASRESDIKQLKKYDVVVTTYAILESCFRKQQRGFKRQGKIIKEKSPLHEIVWYRIVLDEAHNIKERSTNTAKAAFHLQSEYKWCLSGTPLQNRVGELYSLIRFLGGDPFSYYFCKKCDCKSLHWKFSDKRTCDDCGHSPMVHTCFWNNEILTPIQKNGMFGPGRTAFKKLRVLLDRMMLRRTKIERADDLGLPPRTVIVRRDYFSPEEKDIYLSLFSDAKRQFSTYLDQGTVLNNYSNIFTLLTRMRQMACHPDLVIKSNTGAATFADAQIGEATVCRLCNDIAEDAIQSKCRHIFDRECIKQYLNTVLEQRPMCPVCHLPLTIDLEAPALELMENVPSARQGILGRLNLDTWRSSSKIEALLEELSNLRMQDATTKSIVFSQFVNFLDLIAYRLQRAGFNICRLEGSMSPQARDATIQHFMNNTDVTVFLVSLKAGGVALNLTEASRVYLMDSWWNPAVEYQAMDRIHRLGQHRPVQAIKLVIEDSIESRIVQLQEKKSAMVDATLSTDDSAMGRLTPEDLSFLFRL